MRIVLYLAATLAPFAALAQESPIDPNLLAAYRACERAQMQFQRTLPLKDRGPMGAFPPTYEKCAAVRDEYYKANDTHNKNVHANDQRVIDQFTGKK